MTIKPIKRRQLIRWLCSGAALTSIANAAGPRGIRSADPLVEALVSQIRSVRSAAIIGGEYLRQRPDEADTLVLIQQIGRHMETDLRRIAVLQGPDALGSVLRESIRRDFEVGRTESLQGVILSQTELRLCALVKISGLS